MKHGISAVLVLVSLAISSAAGQNSAKGDLDAQLRSVYPWTSVKGRAADVVAQGCVLVVQRDGISTNPSIAPFQAPNNYSGGKVRPAASSILKQDVNTIGRLAPGDRVYVTKTEVKDTSVVVSLLSVEALQVNGLRAKASVAFQFPKGFLATAQIGDVTRVIDELLPFEQRQETGQAPPGNQNPAPARSDPAAQQAPPPANEKPATIELGMTFDQVRAVMGEPKKIAAVGDKKIYFYSDMKVVFVGGVVTDVE